MIAAGKLRHRISLQAYTNSLNTETGDRTPAWVELAKLWAAVEPLSGREFIAAAAAQSQVSARVTIRRRADVQHKQRIVHGAVIYSIEAVLPDKESGREYLTLLCSEGVKDG